MSGSAAVPVPVPAAIHGNFDRLDGDRIVCGWAQDRDAPTAANLQVTVLLDGTAVGSAVASLPRDDGFHGYKVTCSARIQPCDILAGRVVVRAARPAEPQRRMALTVYWSLKRSLAVALANDLRSMLLDDKLAGAIAEELRSVLAPGGRTNPIPTEPEGCVTDAGDISRVGVAVGLRAADDSAIIGHDGHLFIFQGSNQLYDQYREQLPPATVAPLAEGWATLLQHRHALAQRYGAVFLQLVCAEKSSVLPDLFPLPIVTPSPVLAALRAQLAAIDQPWARAAVFGQDLVSRFADRTEAFLRTDSHFSTVGCLSVFLDLLLRVEAARPYSVPATLIAQLFGGTGPGGTQRMHAGDLGERFFGIKLHDVEPVPKAVTALLPLQATAELKAEYSPPSGVVGYAQSWRNREAPIRLRLLVFGGSSFERGTATRGLSWWCKATFREFHFHWAAEFDERLIRELQPDVIIGQTAERFLVRVPNG